MSVVNSLGIPIGGGGAGGIGPRGIAGTNGVGISNITFTDNNDGSVTINITMTDATTYGPFIGTLVSDDLISLNKLSITGTNLADKFLIKKADTSTMFTVNTITGLTTLSTNDLGTFTLLTLENLGSNGASRLRLNTDGGSVSFVGTNTADMIIVTGNGKVIIPNDTNQTGLGSLTKRWAAYFGNGVDVIGNVAISGVNNVAKLSVKNNAGTNVFTVDTTNSIITMGGNIGGDMIPSVDAAASFGADGYVLGSAAKTWKSLHTFYGTVVDNLKLSYLDTYSLIQTDDSSNVVSSNTLAFTINTQNIIPRTDSTYNLGSDTFRWTTVFGDDLNVTGNAQITGANVANKFSVKRADNTDSFNVDTETGLSSMYINEAGIRTILSLINTGATSSTRLRCTGSGGNVSFGVNSTGDMELITANNVAILPNATGQTRLGSSSLRWSTIFGNILNAIGNVVVTGVNDAAKLSVSDSSSVTVFNVNTTTGLTTLTGASGSMLSLLFLNNTGVGGARLSFASSSGNGFISLAPSAPFIFSIGGSSAGQGFTFNDTLSATRSASGEINGLTLTNADTTAGNFTNLRLVCGTNTAFIGSNLTGDLVLRPKSLESVIPYTTNETSLGTSSRRWANFFVTNMTVYGVINMDALTASTILQLDGSKNMISSNTLPANVNLTTPTITNGFTASGAQSTCQLDSASTIYPLRIHNVGAGGVGIRFQNSGFTRDLFMDGSGGVAVTGIFYPSTVVNLGQSTARWSTIFGAAINTSGANSTVRYDHASATNTLLLHNASTSGSAAAVLGFIANAVSGSMHMDINGTFVLTSGATAGSNRAIMPNSDADVGLGRSGRSWKDVWAVTGVVSTSDETKKNTITTSDLGINFINQLRPVKYKFNDGTSNRFHYGLIAQEVKQVLVDNSITTQNFAGYIEEEIVTSSVDENNEPITTNSTFIGLRYHEFMAPMMQAIKDLKAIVDAQQIQITGLQTQIDDLLGP